MAAGWQRCTTCRKVLAADQFDDDGEMCRPCTHAPVSAARTTTRTAVRTARVDPTIVRSADQVGRGDREVRDRRARRTALDQLSEAYPEEFEALLKAARAAEGLG